jgi:RNA polymerase sigma factor (sigma-70 family)
MAMTSIDALVSYLRHFGPAPTGEPEDDGRLLDRFARGDELAFTALMTHYAGLVWGVCRRALPQAQDAEDAFQATFLVLFRKASSLSGGPLGPWLHRVAGRIAAKARARAARRAVREHPAGACVTVDPASEGTGGDLTGETRAVIDEEVGRLPEKYRLPVVLCYLEGLTGEEAARRLSCPPGTILSRPQLRSIQPPATSMKLPAPRSGAGHSPARSPAGSFPPSAGRRSRSSRAPGGRPNEGGHRLTPTLTAGVSRCARPTAVLRPGAVARSRRPPRIRGVAQVAAR